MANNNTSADITATTKPATIANELYRIHCYAKTLTELCNKGSSAVLNPTSLEQIFKDIAAVTDIAAAHLYDSTRASLEIIGNSDHNHHRTLAEAVTK